MGDGLFGEHDRELANETLFSPIDGGGGGGESIASCPTKKSKNIGKKREQRNSNLAREAIIVPNQEIEQNGKGGERVARDDKRKEGTKCRTKEQAS